MPIINIQRRQVEVGRIRIGNSIDTGRKNKHGQPIRKPVKLDAFRFTSPSQALIEQIASLYGGTPARWEPQGGGAAQWEVYTEARAVPVVVPPNAVSQWYEAWTGGMCVRRCDGQREMLKDTPCVCPADPADRNPFEDCKPTTRISLMLADVPGIGVWRCESHGFYAATELPAVAELLASAGGYIPGRLEIEQRTAKRPKANGNGTETRHWMVPVLHVDAAPRTLLGAGNGGGAPAISASGQPAIEAGPPKLTAGRVLEIAGLCQSLGQVQQLWRDAAADGVLTDEVKARLTEVGNGFSPKPVSAPPATAPVVQDGPEPNVDATWAAVMAAAPVDWGTQGVSQRAETFAGKPLDEMDGWDMQRFLTAVTNGEVQ